eukprot:g5602.t1
MSNNTTTTDISSIFRFTSIFMAGNGLFIYCSSWSNPASAAELYGWGYHQAHLQRTVGLFHIAVAGANHFAARSKDRGVHVEVRHGVQVLNFWFIFHYMIETLTGAFGWFAFIFASSLWLLNLYYSVSLLVSVRSVMKRERSLSQEGRRRSRDSSRRNSSTIKYVDDFDDFEEEQVEHKQKSRKHAQSRTSENSFFRERKRDEKS